MLPDRVTSALNNLATPAQPLEAAIAKGRILLFSYAFPPMQVQMTAAVYKPMAAIARSGFAVDVVCADSFCRE